MRAVAEQNELRAALGGCERAPSMQEPRDILLRIHASAPDEPLHAIPRGSRLDLGSPDEIVDEADLVRRERVQSRKLARQRLVDRNHTVAAPVDRRDQGPQPQHRPVRKISDDIDMAERDLAVEAARTER